VSKSTTTPADITAAEAILLLSGLAARSRVANTDRVEVLEVLLEREKRRLVLDAVKGRHARLLKKLEKKKTEQPALPLMAPTPAPVETTEPVEAKAAPKKAKPSDPNVWKCTNPECGHEGPPEDFGWRTQNGRRYRQPRCTPCRTEAARRTAQKARAWNKGANGKNTNTGAPDNGGEEREHAGVATNGKKTSGRSGARDPDRSTTKKNKGERAKAAAQGGNG